MYLLEGGGFRDLRVGHLRASLGNRNAIYLSESALPSFDEDLLAQWQ